MVLLSFTVLTIGGKDVPVLGTVRSSIIDLTGPIGSGFRSATKPIRSWWGGVNDYDRVEAENRELREEVDRLTAKQSSNSTAAIDLARLQEQLNIAFVADIPFEMAQVATGPYSSFDNNTITIDKGASSGIAVDMPVVTSAGLVGNILSVTEKAAVVRLITDPEFSVSVRLVTSGVIGLGHGAGPENPFVIDERVPLDLAIEKGEKIVTSGLETTIFPKDIPVGTVDEVSPSQSALTQVLDLTMAADLVRLDYIRVLKWEPPE